MPWFKGKSKGPTAPATDGDPLVQALTAEIHRRNGADLELDDKAMARIESAAARARSELEGGSAQTQVLLPFLATNSKGPVHFDLILLRSDLDRVDQSSAARSEQ